MQNSTEEFWSIQQLAKNPLQMATRLLAIEKRLFKEYGNESRREALTERLKACVAQSQVDAERAHVDADDVLLEIINDEEISEIYGKIVKMYT